MPKKTKKRETNQKDKKIDSLIESSVVLQKTVIELASNFNELSKQITKLLNLFEDTAKEIAEKNLSIVEETDNETVLEKIQKIIEDNNKIKKDLSEIKQKLENKSQTPYQESVTTYRQAQQNIPTQTYPQNTQTPNFNQEGINTQQSYNEPEEYNQQY